MKVKVKGLKFKVPIIIEPDSVGFHAYSPALKGLHMGGDTEEEALKNARDAAIAYLESMISHGDPIPLDIMELKGAKTALPDNKSYHVEEVKIDCQ
ncbi:MAG: type II toxin-antitoxin system HicB family antitoxin [Dehalococcoidia bacterium]|nr:type II toxin-antitoxin system HicB family antitoxin [Dehalococcoidia bacterium]